MSSITTSQVFPGTPTTPVVAADRITYDIIGYAEIPVDNIRPHPKNPRPSFHVHDDDPHLLELGDSIRTTGQHRAAYVFEIKNHWSMPDEPGQYMLLQGERRWRSCKIARVETLRCLVVATPRSETEEQIWLGVEESHKQEWQQFFLLRFAYNLAKTMGIEITSPELTARTGLKRDDLVKAQKLFSLEPPIQAFVKEYEELLYNKRISRPNARRISGGTGVRTKEFTVAKAVLVWDIFVGIRDNIPHIATALSDLELQLKLANWVTRSKASSNDLEQFRIMLRNFGTVEIPAGFMASLHSALNEESTKTVRQLITATGNRAAVRHSKLIAEVSKLAAKLEASMKDINQIGIDPNQLREDSKVLYRVSRQIDDYDRTVVQPTITKLDPQGDR